MTTLARFSLLALMFILVSRQAGAQALYDLNSITKIEITFTQSDWDYQMDTAKNGDEGFLMAATVVINGSSFDSVGVKYKGNSSYDSTRIKNPLHIELNTYKDQKYQGYTDLKLSNGYGDPSLIREVLAYTILHNYMHCPLSNFAQVYINGNYIGLYSCNENIDKNFCADHFYSSQNTFVKCNPIVTPGPTTKSNFKYISNDSASYKNYYEIKSDAGWKDLIALCDTATNHAGSLDQVIDMDRVIWMLAFNNILINLDSYSGVFSQNHYLYKDQTGHFNPILWDLNMSFGAFPFAGAGSTSMGTQTISSMQQFAINNHAADPNWPLINAVFADSMLKRKYIAHMRTIMEEYFSNNAYLTLANQFMNLIDTAVQADLNRFYTYPQFQHALDSLTDIGSYDVPGIKMLMQARTSYLQSLAEFTAIQPVISSINPGVTSPAYNSTFYMNATVGNVNPNGVWFAYRFDKTQKFIKVPMYDDGLHNDGVSGDDVFGVDLVMQGGQMQYYIYAENNNAGIFSPRRAEHEFHLLHASSSAPTAGQLVINEFLSDNVNHERDEYNSTEDWIELYNNSNQLLDLSDIYLSDKLNHLLKWKFPANTTIAPNGFLTIWADDDSMQQILHSNFQLNKDSGLVLLSNGSGQILDSISFQAQTTNVSFGRYPNGTGAFIPMNTTYGTVNNNYPLSVSGNLAEEPIAVFPNPASDEVTIRFKGARQLTVYTMSGKPLVCLSGNDVVQLNTGGWANGLYLLRCGRSNRKLLVQH